MRPVKTAVIGGGVHRARARRAGRCTRNLVECGPQWPPLTQHATDECRSTISTPNLNRDVRIPGACIVSIWDKRIENAISIRITPAFLPHQRPVSMSTPCAGRCTSVDRFSIPPMSIRPNETILESGGKIARNRTQAAATRAVGVPAHRLAGGMRSADILPSATFHWSMR